MTYEAIIAPLENGVKHPNADRLKVFSVCGKRVIVGLDHFDGEIGVFFPDDGLLSEKFCVANDLFPRYDETGARIGGGFFDPKKPRVRAQNFRGHKSEGFWMPLDCLTFSGLSLEKIKDSMPVGTTFDTINGIQICEKYFTPATLRQMKSSGKVQKQILGFPKHIDTKQFSYEGWKIEMGARVYITEKLHGTSGRTAYAVVKKEPERTFWDKVFKRNTKPTKAWKYLTGTRNVILGENAVGSGFYGDDTFRHIISDQFKTLMHKNEIIYYEIVGYAAGVPIMPPHPVKEMKTLKKQYGSEMNYRYGCLEGQNKIFVYRIAFANEDGHCVDLPWEKVKLRCHELGLEYVPELAPNPIIITSKTSNDAYFKPDLNPPLGFSLAQYVEDLEVGSSTIDHTHIREGVVLRVENPNGDTHFLKSKSYDFKVLEGIIKSDDSYVDTEEIS